MTLQEATKHVVGVMMPDLDRSVSPFRVRRAGMRVWSLVNPTLLDADYQKLVNDVALVNALSALDLHLEVITFLRNAVGPNGFGEWQ